MGKENFEQILGLNCALTFIGLKAASLLSLQKDRFQNLDDLLAQYQPCFHCKGISLMKLCDTNEKCMLLIFRLPSLCRLLQQPAAREILQRLGYPVNDPLQVQLEFLKKRLYMSTDFPHEIGLFLGYPPADVQGFIAHGGKNFSYVGYWKVYVNEQSTRKLFSFYATSTQHFCRRLKEGEKIEDLLLAI